MFTRVSNRLRHCLRVGLGLAAVGVLAVEAIPDPSPAAPNAREISAIYERYGASIPIVDMRGELAVYQSADDTPTVDCAKLTGKRAMIAFVFGQSNASNTVDPGYASTQAVYAYDRGICRKVHDAVPGATGSKGSSWSRLGDRIISSGLYDTVLLVNIARGGTSILNWGPQGDFHALLIHTLDELRDRGLTPTHIFFHQGEADCLLGLTHVEYQAVLETILADIRSHAGPNNAIFISRASLFMDPTCGNARDPACFKSCPAITAAQTAVADPKNRIFPGPNTDLLVPWFDRNDGYHFTAQGADRFAAAWMPLLTSGAMSAQSWQ